MSCLGTDLSLLILFLWGKYSSNSNLLMIYEDFEYNLIVNAHKSLIVKPKYEE